MCAIKFVKYNVKFGAVLQTLLRDIMVLPCRRWPCHHVGSTL